MSDQYGSSNPEQGGGWTPQQPGQHNPQQNWQQAPQHQAGQPQQGWQDQGQQQNWQQGQPQQGWQQAPQQNWQQGQPQQGWQQPPAGWTPQGQPPAGRRRNLPMIITAVVVVIALAVGVTIFFLSKKDTTADGGAGTPEQAVQSALASFSTGDTVSLLSNLDPAEAKPILDASSDGIAQLKRLGILSADADPNAIAGAGITTEGLTFDESARRTINDHLQMVTITGGKITVKGVNPADLPFSDKVKAALEKANIDLPASGPHTFDLADVAKQTGEPLQVATVKRGDKWYLSVFYSIAENWYQQASKNSDELKAADLQTAITRVGGSSPEDATRQFIDKTMAGDYEGMIGMLAPDEMGVMYDYGKRILAAAHPGTPSDLPKITDLQFNTAEVTAGTKVSLKSISLEQDGKTYSIAVDTDADTVTVTEDGNAKTYDVEQLITGMGGADSTRGMPAQVRDIVKRVFGKALEIGVVTTQVDGKWYVSPLRSYSGILITLMQGLEPGDIDYLLSLIPEKR